MIATPHTLATQGIADLGALGLEPVSSLETLLRTVESARTHVRQPALELGAPRLDKWLIDVIHVSSATRADRVAAR